MALILIVDPDQSFATALGRVIRDLGHRTEWARDRQEALRKYRNGGFAIVATETAFPQMDGIQFICELKRLDNDAVVFVITSHACLRSAVEALTGGAYDYLEKPVSIEQGPLTTSADQTACGNCWSAR